MADQVTRQLNTRAVMDQFLAGEPISRAEIARRCGLSKQAVSEIVAELEASGRVGPTGELAGGHVGRAATLYSINPASGLVIGVDLGGTKITAALGDFGGAVLDEATVRTDPRGGHHVIDQIAALAGDLARAQGSPPHRVACLALGSPGALDRSTGVMAFAPNIPSFGDLDVARELSARLGFTVVVDNDVNMAVLGEQWAGWGRGLSDFVLISVGTGIGMGIVIGGELRTGATGAAGEIAYLPLGADPFDPASRLKGALEEAVGGAGLARRHAALHGSGATDDRHRVPEIFAAAVAGEPAARAAVEEEARLLALAVAAVAAVLDPELVVLGGGIGSRPELLEPVRSWLDRLMPGPTVVRTSALGARAGVLGAVAVALRTAHARAFATPSALPTAVPAPTLDRLR
jgi:predicted NBD/HSP70 family sugar kinase